MKNIIFFSRQIQIYLRDTNLSTVSDFVAHINRKLSESFSIDVGQVIVGVSLPLTTLEFGNHFKAVMGVVAVITR